MKQSSMTAQYLQIALDLAARIAQGELEEGKRIYGRSLMASEYQVSPETIRRSLRLLADHQVVEVKPQSGVVVLSAANARTYMERFGENAESAALRSELKSLLHEYGEMNHRLREIVTALVREQDTVSPSELRFPTYKIPIPSDSPLIGTSLGTLHFWQATGGTVTAIRRGQNTILSPGPDEPLQGDDILLMVGLPAAAEAARELVRLQEPQNRKEPL